MSSIRCISILLFILLVQIIFTQTISSQSLLRIKENNLWGYINLKGEVVIKPKFHYAGDFSGGLAPARLDSFYGFIDSTGEFVITPEYDYALDFSEGFAIVITNGNYNYVNSNGKLLLPTPNNYEHLGNFINGRAHVFTNFYNSNYKTGIIDTQGKLIIDTSFQRIYDFEDGIAIVEQWNYDKKEGPYIDKTGIIDTSGNFIVSFGTYRDIRDFYNGFAKVSIKDNRTGFINTKGDLIFRDTTHDFFQIKDYVSDNLINVKISLGDKFDSLHRFIGFSSYDRIVDLNGVFVINNPEYEYITEFSHGRAFAEIHDRYILIDRNGLRVGKSYFDNYTRSRYWFKNGLSIASENKKWGIIDTGGNFVVQPLFDDIHNTGIIDDYFFPAIDYPGKDNKPIKKWGVCSTDGNMLVKPRFDDIDKNGFQNGVLKVYEDGRIGYVDTHGNYLWREKPYDEKKTYRLNIDYMLNEGRYDYTHNNTHTYNLITKGAKPEKILDSQKFLKNNLDVRINENEKVLYRGKYAALSLYIANNTRHHVGLQYNDNDWLLATIQAKDSKGNWSDIEDWKYIYDFAGNDFESTTYLDAGYYWKFAIPEFDGSFRTKLRVKVVYKDDNNKDKTIFSNEIETNVNPAQFWRNRFRYRRYGELEFFDGKGF